MGVVWRGHDRVSDATYAIKVLRPDYASDAAAVSRFVRERTALLSFRHPNVVTLHDMIVEGDRLALVMDLVRGGDLNMLRRSRGGTLPPAEAARLAAQVADALAAAHAAGITHRDIKPGNVLMLDEGHVLLADFGIARLAWQSGDTSTGLVLGTAEYLAPELISGQEPGPAGDVYGLGVTLYELIAGKPPFTGNPAAVLHAHVSATPERPAGIDDRLWSLIRDCLAKSPAARPSAAELAAALGGAAGAARGATVAGGAIRAGRAEATGAAGAGAGAAAAGAGAAAAAAGAGAAAAAAGAGVAAGVGAGAGGGAGAGAGAGATGAQGVWGPTGAFHEVSMQPFEDLAAKPTVATKRRFPSRLAAIASAVAIVAAIVAVIAINPFKTVTAKTTGDIAAPVATTSSLQPTADPKTSRAAATTKAKPKAKTAGATASAGSTGGGGTSQPTSGSSTAPATTTTTTATTPTSDDTAWECSADSTQDTTHGKTLKSCIKIDGTTVELQGYAWTIPAGLAASGEYEQVEIVLHTESGDIGHYMSPDCAAGTCEYSLSVTESAGTYWAQAEFYWDGTNEYQASLTPQVTVTG
jgi:serine/threonine protein kinase, bacterial